MSNGWPARIRSWPRMAERLWELCEFAPWNSPAAPGRLPIQNFPDLPTQGIHRERFFEKGKQCFQDAVADDRVGREARVEEHAEVWS